MLLIKIHKCSAIWNITLPANTWTFIYFRFYIAIYIWKNLNAHWHAIFCVCLLLHVLNGAANRCDYSRWPLWWRHHKPYQGSPNVANMTILNALIECSIDCPSLYNWPINIQSPQCLSQCMLYEIGFGLIKMKYRGRIIKKHISSLSNKCFWILWSLDSLCFEIIIVAHVKPSVHQHIKAEKKNGYHFADDISKCIFLNENVWFPIKISLKFVPKGLINNIPALV